MRDLVGNKFQGFFGSFKLQVYQPTYLLIHPPIYLSICSSLTPKYLRHFHSLVLQQIIPVLHWKVTGQELRNPEKIYTFHLIDTPNRFKDRMHLNCHTRNVLIEIFIQTFSTGPDLY